MLSKVQGEMSESVFKVLVIGEPCVGKTSMVARYCYRDWIENYKATVGGSQFAQCADRTVQLAIVVPLKIT